MLTDNTKKIFNSASKATEVFIREAISVFPKLDTERIKLADVSKKDISVIKAAKKRLNKADHTTKMIRTLEQGGLPLSTGEHGITDQEIKGVLEGTIKKPTGIHKRKKILGIF